MKIKGIKNEVFNDYKDISMLIAMNSCDFKCENEGLCPQGSCQNSSLTKSKSLDIDNSKIVQNYLSNELTKACILGALEPMLQIDEIIGFVKEFRNHTNDTLLIFTGYYPDEIKDEIQRLKEFDNIILKCGRYIEDSDSVYDELLGVSLASSNQYAKRIEDL